MTKLLFVPLFFISLSSVLLAQAEVENKATVHSRDLKRHQMVMEKIEKQQEYDILFLGDSITHLLDEPKHLHRNWLKNSDKNYKHIAKELKGRTFLNAGISGEDTTHLLSRLKDGMSKVQSKFTVIMIGTNDARSSRTAAQVAANIKESIGLIQKDNAETQVILYGIFPRGSSPKDKSHLKNQVVNKILATYPDEFKNVKYVDISKDLVNSKNQVTKELFYDLLHPSLKGYKIWVKSIKEETDLKKVKSSKTNHAMRFWTNKAGKKAYAKFVSNSEETVILKLKNGKHHTFQLSELSQADQDYVKGLAAAIEK